MAVFSKRTIVFFVSGEKIKKESLIVSEKHTYTSEISIFHGPRGLPG
jgi:hypothetical protein